MKSSLILSFLTLVALGPTTVRAQKQTTPRIEESTCIYKAESSYKTRCGYLIVRENRQRPHGNEIKLPFIYVESKSAHKDPTPLLFSGGGPGLSALHTVTAINNRKLLEDRDYIAFDQRGTHFAVPNLECDGNVKAVQQAYLDHQSTEDAANRFVRDCYQKLARQGIDLSAYNTDESASDIEDLRRLLKIESLNLMGISYSGGLMMAVLQKYPEHIRSVVLDSPLPEFVDIDEDELANFSEALTSVLNASEITLAARFHAYLLDLNKKTLSIKYQLSNGTRKDLSYGRPELLSVIHSKLEDYDGVQTLALVVENMIGGKQEPYIKQYFDGVFNGGGSLSGMRLSVYCSDKMAYADPGLIHQQDTTMPWLAGFHVNDVYKATCDGWPVKPIQASTKKPFYSNVPALLGSGGLDDAVRPWYNDVIHHYLLNSQSLLFAKRQHAPLLNSLEGDFYIASFLDNPWQPLKGQNDIEVH